MINNLINNDIAQLLSQKFGTSVKIEAYNSVGGGCINNATKITTSIGDFFLKWSNNLPEDIFLREAESLKELKKAAKNIIRIPNVVGAKKIDETPGYLLLEFLKNANNQASQKILGEGLATIHLYRNEQFGFYNNNYCGATLQNNSWNASWIDFFGKQRLWKMIEKIENQQKLNLKQLKAYESLVVKLPKLIDSECEVSLIHGDLWSGNYMTTEGGFALIDPACYYANREMEFGIITMFGGFSNDFWQGYNQVYPLPNDWQERNLLYQLYHILNHYYLFGGGYGIQAFNVAQKYI